MDADTLFINQTEIYEALTKLLTNIKKDGSERKTIDIYKRKADMLEAYWQEYQDNHSKLCEFANPNHVYFEKGCFDTAQQVYVRVREIIDRTIDQIGKKQLLGVSPRRPEVEAPPQPSSSIFTKQLSISQGQQQVSPRRPDAEAPKPPSTKQPSVSQREPEAEVAPPRQGTSSRYEEFQHREESFSSVGGPRLERLMKKQIINFKALERTVSRIEVDKFENKWLFENALKSLDSRWGDIDKLHWEIEGENGEYDSVYQEEFCRHEEIYCELTNTIHGKMSAVKHREQSAPQINIPMFHGTYSHWVSFKDLFCEAIDKNPSMSNAQKMQFLKSKVAGEAERLIHHLQISSENYRVCWDILSHRYGNQKLIFTSHINILLGLPNMQQQSLPMIKKLHDVTKETLHAIKNLGVDITTWDPLLVHLLAQKLDNETFTEYVESVKNPRELPSLQEFLGYLEMKFTALEASSRKPEPANQKTITPQPSKSNHYQNQKKGFQRNNNHHTLFSKENSKPSLSIYHVSRSLTCGTCNAEHGLWQCPEFLKMTNEQKLNKIKQLEYCNNCLCNHFKKPCLSKKRCRKCLGVHNTLLHDALENQSQTNSAKLCAKTTKSVATKENISRSSNVSWDDTSEILLATAVVKVTGADGSQHEMRALVDQGSQLSLINEKAAQVLGLKRAQFKGQIFGVGEKENNAKGLIEITIESSHSNFSLHTNVIIMNNLIKRLPNNSFTKPETWDHIQGIELADPKFNISRPIDLLLGADVYSKIMLGGILRGSKDDQPLAQQTQLGWLLCGSTKPHYHCNVVLNNTDDLLKFWENEDINQKIDMSKEDHECLQYFLETTKRLKDGRYEVRLPLKPELKDKLGATKPQALAQLRNLEKKLDKSEGLRIEYHKFTSEYTNLNHMKPSIYNQTPECYLPHHAVTRAESTTTKLRVVFNASAKSSSGYSLNDILYRGPNIQRDSTKTLGLGWNPQRDNFIFDSKIESESPTVATKRSLLSDISKLFDPLGWLTPLSTTMKILFQNVWMSKLEWDEKLPEKIDTEWSILKKELKLINDIEINRWLGMEENQNIELHGFCDASNKAYACCIYCKIIKSDKTTIQLVAGKARLGPLSKNVSIPRLELMGAQLLTQLMQKVQSCLSNYQTDVYCWTDSTAVLGWIKGDPARWKPFVSNRVTLITKTIPANQWRYVKTTDNPADSASRGLTAKQLKDHSLWWQGPPWLESFTKKNDKTIYETTLETKPSYLKQTIAVVQTKQNCATMFEIINNLLNKFSTISKIIRIVAWILRIPACRKRVHQPYLELHELRRAKMLIIKSTQQIEFANEIDSINKHGKVQSKSKILNLNPMKDEQGILRAYGRLRNANINFEMKHPIIMPHNHRLTTLLIDQAHKLTFHGGVRLTLANLRQKYWVVGGYIATKMHVRKCVVCRRQDPEKQYQLMGDLPGARVNPENAFHHCGVDYTGFVEVKANKGRGIKTTKGYIAVFICMVTKAVHLELVSDLTSTAFLAALTRMAARRGAPRHVYSDNGTNFVGANRMIQEEYDQLKQVFSDSFLTEVSEMGIQWHFNVPNWPNAGGLWERAVRSLKHHLKRVVGQQKLTFEEYTTLLAKLEACLNSRPLCALSEEPDDFDFLTPAHFLSGKPGSTIIETEHDARTRWHLTSKIFADLWKRWKTEYLVQLSSRTKWMEPRTNINIGDLVVIHDDNLPPGKWALGRVTDTHPGDEGLVRAVSLKTKNGMIKRPIVKLSILPINQNDDKTKPNQKPPEPEDTTRTPKRKGTTRSTIATVATTLLCLTMIFSPAYCLHEIKQLPNNQTLYFDPISKVQLIRDKWTLVVYYDMGPYWRGINTYNQILSYLDKLCGTIEKRSPCNTIVQQARHDYQEVEYYNELLLTQHFDGHARRQRNVTQTGRRQRRGLINGVGYLANELFGVLDSRFADQYVKDIETINNNEKHLSKLWKNQTSIIEAEFNLMKKMETTIDKQHKQINRKLLDLQDNTSTLQREIQNISYVQDFTLTAMAGNSLIQGLKRLQDTLLDTITDIYHGQLSTHLLTPTQLKRELQTIYGQMPSELTLPITNIDTDIQYMYHLLKVKARAMQKYIVIEVTFPLTSRESFKLYKLSPIPHQTGTSMIKLIPVSEYVAVNLKKDSYFSITTTEIKDCLLYGTTYLCQFSKPILTIKGDENFCEINRSTKKCKVVKSTCSNIWVELHLTPHHLYFCCDMYRIKVICGDQITIRQLSQSGVIAISQDCVIKGKDFTLYPIRHQSNQLNITPTIYLPELDQINHIVNIKIPEEISTDNGNLNTSMTSLGQAIEKLKNSNADVDEISSHNIHHYALGYITLAGALCAAAVWMWRSGRCCPCRDPAPGHRGEGRCRQESAATSPTPRPRRRSGSPHRQEAVGALAPPGPTSVQSEVLSASELNKQSEIAFRLHSYAKRWPSRNYSAVKRDKMDTNTGHTNNGFAIEESIV